MDRHRPGVVRTLLYQIESTKNINLVFKKVTKPGD